MSEKNKITVTEISEKLEVGVTTITKRIRRLKEKGIIDRKGSKKNGQWIVKCGKKEEC